MAVTVNDWGIRNDSGFSDLLNSATSGYNTSTGQNLSAYELNKIINPDTYMYHSYDNSGAASYNPSFVPSVAPTPEQVQQFTQYTPPDAATAQSVQNILGQMQYASPLTNWYSQPQAGQATQFNSPMNYTANMQQMQDEFKKMMEAMQKQNVAPFVDPTTGYAQNPATAPNTNPSFGYNFQPTYSNPLMRPVTANSNIAPQQAPNNMGYQNRSTLWGDV